MPGSRGYGVRRSDTLPRAAALASSSALACSKTSRPTLATLGPLLQTLWRVAHRALAAALHLPLHRAWLVAPGALPRAGAILHSHLLHSHLLHPHLLHLLKAHLLHEHLLREVLLLGGVPATALLLHGALASHPLGPAPRAAAGKHRRGRQGQNQHGSQGHSNELSHHIFLSLFPLRV